MPISDEFATEIIKSQFELIKSLRDEVASLTELLISKASVDESIKIEIPESSQHMGKIPWYMRKKVLEKASRKPRLSEISGSTEELPDAS